jgi:signal transduction histidine kinase
MSGPGAQAPGKKHPLGARLALSYLVVILFGMGIIAPLDWLAVERLYQNSQGANLLAQAQLIAAALSTEASPSGDPVPYSQLSNLQPGIHTRVIDSQGAVVIGLSNQVQPASPEGLSLPQLALNRAGLVTAEELLSRPEIEQARAGRPATAIRRVEVAGGRAVLYAAAPVPDGNGSVVQIVYLAEPLPDIQWTALPPSVRWQLAGVILAALLLAGGAGLFFARRISRPLEKLAFAARAVANGDLDQTVPEDPGISELSTLGRAFNSMTSSLRQSDRAKNAFLADVTHELRTPLTVIKGTIETLQDGALDDLEAREPFLDSMGRETDRLIRLVNDLLVLARVDAGALNLQLQPVDLWELARWRCDNIKHCASQRQVRVETVISPQPGEQAGCLVIADADRLAQVLDNLLDNAIRYSPAGSVTKVTVGKENDRVICQVTDSGPGIPAEHLPLIFERFYRVDPARGRSQGGSGLGLAIVRGFVQAHGGEVSASSVEGQGATLAFWLPAASI